jgi:hypothetical protein
MYGMVNRALQDMVQSHFGETQWESIRRKAVVDTEVFVSNREYRDAVTYTLINATAEVLGLPSDQVLRDFGRHWVLTTARESYGELLEAGGHSLPEFLENLPNFHARVSLIFPHLKPPRFKYSDQSGNGLRLHYYSDRAGLAPFVIGLVDGLGGMFQTPLVISHEIARGSENDHDVFQISWAGGLS